jgi:alkylation response protein AidB-like acyl-CoA dehydrogenase
MLAAMTPRESAPLTRLQEDEQQFRLKVRQFAEETVRPLVGDMDQRAEFPRSLVDALFALGVMGIEIPEAYDGGGGTFFQAVVTIEELARVDPAVAVLVDVQNALVNTAVLRTGSALQKQRYLPALAANTVGAYAMSERTAGSDAFALTSRAELKGDAYVLNGRKMWITNAAEAGLFLVFANARPDQGAQGVTAFLVDRASDGLSFGKRENKLGIRASSTCEVILDNVRVAQENVLGPVGAGSKIAVETLNEGRIGIAAQMLGLAQGAFEAALGYAQQRRQFGQPIAAFQGVQFPLAEMATDIEAARLLVYNAARLKEAGATPAERFRSASMAKYFASRVAESVASQAVEIFGGCGFIKDFPAEKFYRDAKVGKIYEGTSNMQLRTIATTLLDHQ